MGSRVPVAVLWGPCPGVQMLGHLLITRLVCGGATLSLASPAWSLQRETSWWAGSGPADSTVHPGPDPVGALQLLEWPGKGVAIQ